jgi:hypothetical protein
MEDKKLTMVSEDKLPRVKGQAQKGLFNFNPSHAANAEEFLTNCRERIERTIQATFSGAPVPSKDNLYYENQRDELIAIYVDNYEFRLNILAIITGEKQLLRDKKIGKEDLVLLHAGPIKKDLIAALNKLEQVNNAFANEAILTDGNEPKKTPEELSKMYGFAEEGKYRTNKEVMQRRVALEKEKAARDAEIKRANHVNAIREQYADKLEQFGTTDSSWQGDKALKKSGLKRVVGNILEDK